MTATLEMHISEIKKKHQQEQELYVKSLVQLCHGQRRERFNLALAQKQWWKREELTRVKRLRSGIKGLWDRFTGNRGKVSRQNEVEEKAAKERDNQEKQNLINQQMIKRRELLKCFAPMRTRHKLEKQKLRQEIAFHLGMAGDKRRDTARTQSRNIERNHIQHQRDTAPELSMF